MLASVSEDSFMRKIILLLVLIVSCSFAQEDFKMENAAHSKYVIPTRQPWSNPTPVVFYTKAFAYRLGLYDSDIIKFEPGLEAIQVLFEREFDFDYTPKDPFIEKYHLDKLTPEQRDTVNNHLSALPILFPDEKMPLYVHYDCTINLYLNTDDARVKDIQLPDRPIWWDHNINDRIIYSMLAPIQTYQITAADDPDLKSVANNEPKKLIANYYSYLDKVMGGPKAALTSRRDDLGDPQKRILLTFNSHYKDFLPGLHYLSFKVPYCDLLDSGSVSKGLLVWVQKAIDKNAPLPLKYDATQFYAFQIPAEVSNAPIMKKIHEFNSRPLAGRGFSKKPINKSEEEN